MRSETYELFLRAMEEEKQIVCPANGFHRELCPILLGRSGDEEMTLVYQFAGETSEGPIPPGGDWKCLRLSNVRDVVLREGRWISGGSHLQKSKCI